MDLRRMNNKRPVTYEPLTTMVHPDSGWSKGHMMHVFFQKKCVFSMVIPVISGPHPNNDNKRVLEEVRLVQCTEVDYEVEEDQDAAEKAPPQEESQQQQQAAAVSRPKVKKAKQGAE